MIALMMGATTQKTAIFIVADSYNPTQTPIPSLFPPD
jgi:hypothetical protein